MDTGERPRPLPIATWLSKEQLEALGAFRTPSKQRYTGPAITTFHNILVALPPETPDNAVDRWTGQHGAAHAPVAMDGKNERGTSKQTENWAPDDGRGGRSQHRQWWCSGRLKSTPRTAKSRSYASSPPVSTSQAGSSMDAMHAQNETAHRADYVLSAVKDNHQSILEDLKAIDFSEAPRHETTDTGLVGRINRGRCAVVDFSAAEGDGYAKLHSRCQAMYTKREREILKNRPAPH